MDERYVSALCHSVLTIISHLLAPVMPQILIGMETSTKAERYQQSRRFCGSHPVSGCLCGIPRSVHLRSLTIPKSTDKSVVLDEV